jgi:hypothetical protein
LSQAMSPIISIKNINKVYDSGFQALKTLALISIAVKSLPYSVLMAQVKQR